MTVSRWEYHRRLPWHRHRVSLRLPCRIASRSAEPPGRARILSRGHEPLLNYGCTRTTARRFSSRLVFQTWPWGSFRRVCLSAGVLFVTWKRAVHPLSGNNPRQSRDSTELAEVWAPSLETIMVVSALGYSFR